MNELATTLEINDPEIDLGKLSRLIRDRLTHRQQQAQARGFDYAALVDEPEQPLGAVLTQHDLVAELQLLRQSDERLRQDPIITDWRVPLINGLLNWLKRPIHQLALMYTNNLATRQIIINRLIRWTLEGLVGARQVDLTRMAALEEEVAQLRERLARLESRAA